MANDAALKEILVALAENAKTHYVVIDSLRAEIEALRETVRSLDPTFSDVIAHRRKVVFEENSEVRTALITAHDAIILKAKAM